MSEHNITVAGGESVRLLTAGKYCERDIVVTAEGGGGGGGDIDALIDGSITEIKSNVSWIYAHTFAKRRKLVTAEFPEATSIGEYAFNDCISLTSISAPKTTEIGANAFSSAIIRAAVFPLVENVLSNAFRYCIRLETVRLDSLTSLAQNAFQGCSNLSVADLGIVQSVNSGTFNNCGSLKSVILRKTSMTTLASSYAFASTPIESGTGYIYVPATLVDTYKAATNWSTYAAQFRALEDYTVDGTVTGELDESKI